MSSLPCAATHAEAFAAMVRAHPHAAAVVADTATLSFASLQRRAAAVADALLTAVGVAPPRVALLAPNTAQAAEGLLGILGLGAGAVLLDPANPPARLSQMLTLAAPGALLVHPELVQTGRTLAAAMGLPLLELDGRESDAGYPLRASAPAHDVAVVFTSGSTGQPKGCVESEADSLERCRIYGDLIGLGPGSVVGVVHHFSGSRMQPNSALLRGAAIAFYDFARLGLAPLPGWMERHGVDSMRLFPTTFRQLADAMGRGARLPGLRCLVLTGEAVQAADVVRLRELAPQATCMAVYSSTETGPMAALVVRPQDPLPGAPLHLGQPLPGKRLICVDAHGAPLPAGAVGEIALDSRHVFQGYLGDPAGDRPRLSAPDAAGRRRFLTGDLGRVDERGRLWHAGRADGLVKVRGHRIELGEIETLLLQAPGVAHAAVRTWQRRPGVDSLVAYVVPAEGQMPDSRALREHLGVLLPAAMLPARFEILTAPPLGTTGKLQRDALPTPAPYAAGDHARFADPTMAALASLWMDVLDRRDIRPDSDFFEAGGDSLCAATLLVEVEALFGVRLPLTALAEHPTLEAQVRLIGAPHESPAAPSLVTVRRGGPDTPLHVIAGLNGHVLRFVQLAHDLPSGQPVRGLQPPGLAWDADRSIETMAAYYVEQMRAGQPRGPYRLLGASFGGTLAFEVALQLERAGHAVDWVCMLDTHRPDCREDADWLAELDPQTRRQRLVRQQLAAGLAYRPGGRLRAPLHHVLCVEYVLRPGDARDWRGHCVQALRVHPVPGIHGAFHFGAQRRALVRLLRRLLAGEDVAGVPPATFFDAHPRPRDGSPAATAHVQAAVERVQRRPRHLQVSGWFASARGAVPAPPERLLVSVDGDYLGWSPLFLLPQGGDDDPGWRRRDFDLKIPLARIGRQLRLGAAPAAADRVLGVLDIDTGGIHADGLAGDGER